MSILGQRPRPVTQEGVTDAPTPAPAPFVDDLTGWTPDDALPRWAGTLAYCAGVCLRKLWLYVCAPAGALTLTIAILAAR